MADKPPVKFAPKVSEFLNKVAKRSQIKLDKLNRKIVKYSSRSKEAIMSKDKGVLAGVEEIIDRKVKPDLDSLKTDVGALKTDVKAIRSDISEIKKILSPKPNP